ncbi:MAG: cysteine--tRNA ligase [Nitrospirae bacterium]|nr:cysteine--tRNA ligase [Nitrospirota bacterium]
MKIFNSLSNSKESFEPIRPKHVRMYVCGVTVYDDCHLGHARSAVVFDVIRRYLRYLGYQVTFVKNFTDIDDKILNRASQENMIWTEVVNKYIEAYYRDMNRLGVEAADVEPRATDHMPHIVNMIQGLIDGGFAYSVDGDVYYRVGAYESYGRLSRRNLEDMLAGARVEIDERKQDPMDFALWKKAKPEEPSWDSPWGKGRPGWHIECSAMSIHHLGETFDIHGGGKDLIFPHHENEIAQACALTKKEFAKFWVHNGFVTIDQEKMSKSLGNFFTIWEIFEKSNCSVAVTSESLRYFFFTTHYRSDLNFSNQVIEEAKATLDGFYGLFQQLEEEEANPMVAEGPDEKDWEYIEKGFIDAMDDDFNTPKALAELHQFRGLVNTRIKDGLSQKQRNTIREVFRRLGKVLGLFQLSVHAWEFRGLTFVTDSRIDGPPKRVSDEWIQEKLQKRVEAREKKDYATADQTRQELASKGIIIEDRPDGTTRWKRG